MKQLVLAGALMLSFAAQAACQSGTDNWPEWSGFREKFISDDGRVIDNSVPEQHTTSEGQSYGLFFALAANDRDTFARLLRWTEDNLAGGDLAARLPAWQWGKRKDGSWGVIDGNAAADSDLWIAYALGEAGRLWKVRKYAALSQLLAERVLREETVAIPGLGQTLLPGPVGFQPQSGSYRLNPSYVPLHLVRRLAATNPQPEWKQLVASSLDLIVRASPRGYAPDWVLHKDGSFAADAETNAVGSYNAIRVYLWAGVLNEADPAQATLLKTFAPAAKYVVDNGAPPLEADTRTGSASGIGSAGFSAAMLPFLSAARQTQALRLQRLRVEAKAPLERNDNYYDQVLTLFGLGWMDGRYRFAADGALSVKWICNAD